MCRPSIAVHPLTPVIGAEIAGVDLSDLDDDDYRAIHESFLAHGVVFFRGQDISIETQKAFGAHFGELVVHPNDPGVDGHPEVMMIHADEGSKRVAGELCDLGDVAQPSGRVVRVADPDQGGAVGLVRDVRARELRRDPRPVSSPLVPSCASAALALCLVEI